MSSRVLVVDDEAGFRDLYSRCLTEAGFRVVCAEDAASAQAILQAEAIDMVVSDVRMPGESGIELLKSVRQLGLETPFLLVTAWADVRDAVAALKLGAVDYLSKPVDLDELVVVVEDTLGTRTRQALGGPPADLLEGIVADSPSMRELLRNAWSFAQSEVSVLVTGESGVGKELVARFLHRASERARGPFVPVNCAAMPSTLLASELFGHDRGAFTGATNARLGRFREANGGVLFLDEIGDMPLDMQPVLLRALEERRVRPVGGGADVEVDFRLVAATNLDLESAVASGDFRADLYFRLNVVSLPIPPLRQRREDIAPLARKLLALDGGSTKRISSAALRLLEDYPWPGNVRELANAMKRARLLSRTDIILPECLPEAVRRAKGPASPVAGSSVAGSSVAGSSAAASTDAGGPVSTLREMEIQSLQRALESTGGNRTHAAELLGISRRGLLKKLKRFGLTEAS